MATSIFSKWRVLFFLLVPSALWAAPSITVSASAVTLLGTTQNISITVQLIDPFNTGMLRVSGTGIVPIMRASTVTPGTTATVGPIYGNDVILNGFGVANNTYYLVQVFTVTGGLISSTPSLQNFYAFTGSGTIDLATATPLVPNFMNSSAGVSIPGNFSVTGASITCILNGMYVAGTSCYPTIQNAVTAAAGASPQGSVLIPSSYAGTDSATNATSVNIRDERQTSNQTSFWGVIGSLFPSKDNSGNLAPLGGDLRFRVRGAGDAWITNDQIAATTTTATISIGANPSVLVGSTANFGTGFSAPIVIGRETGSEEVVSAGSWSVVDLTHLSITAAKSHSGTTDIEQIGSGVLRPGYFITVPCINPSQLSTRNAPMRWFDGGNSTVELYWPCNTADTWPYSAMRWGGVQTGANGANLNYVYRNNTSSSQFIWENAANTGNLANLQESSGLGTLTVTGNLFGVGVSASGVSSGATVLANQGAVCTNGELALSGGWQSTGTATVTAVAGTGQTCSWTITTGTTTAANPTVTDTLTNALPAATTVCEMNIHGGTHTAVAGEGFTQTTLSATAPIFTFIGTPTANGFTYFVTRRCGP